MQSIERVKSLVTGTADLLNRLTNSDFVIRAEDHWYHNDNLANQLADLLAAMMDFIAVDGGRAYPENALLIELREVFGLTGSPLRPASSNAAIKVAFQAFAEHLCIAHPGSREPAPEDPPMSPASLQLEAV